MWVIRVINVNMAGCYRFRCLINIKPVLDPLTSDGKYSCQSQTLVVNVFLVWNLKPVWPFVTPERNAHEERPSHTHAESKCRFCDVSVSFTHMSVCVLRFTAPCWRNETSTLLPFLGVFLCGQALVSSAHPSLISPDGFPCCSAFHWEHVLRFCRSVE